MKRRPSETARMARWHTPGLSAAAMVLAVGALAGFVRAALIVPLHVPLDPNEGWNAYHATAAVTSGSPYPPPLSFMINNYPPLSFYVIGGLGSLLGDDVVAGRVISLASFAIVCACIAVVLRWVKTDWSSGILAASLFACTLLVTSDYVGMNDPQLLGHALQLAGLLFALRGPRAGASMAAAAAFFVLGGLVKHNLFALPLGCVVWLFICDRRNAIRLVAGLLVLSVGAFFIVKAGLGVDLLQQIDSARAFSFAQMETGAVNWLATAAVPLCALFFLVFRKPREEFVVLVAVYAVVSIVSGVIFLGGAGVDVNVMFDADIAAALGAGLAASRLVRSDGAIPHAAVQLFAGLCILPFAVLALGSSDWRASSFWLHPMREETALARQDITFLRMHTGPAMCEDLTFCYWAGKKATVDVFNLEQEFDAGVRKRAPLLQSLRERTFASVELDETAPFPFSGSVETTFRQNYQIDHGDDEGTFFVPREPGPHGRRAD